MLALLSKDRTLRSTDHYCGNRQGDEVGTKWTVVKCTLDIRLRRYSDLPILENIKKRSNLMKRELEKVIGNSRKRNWSYEM